MIEREIFFSALDIEDAQARREHLKSACAGDTALLARVQSLITSHEGESRFLKIPVVEQLSVEIPEVISTTILHIAGSTYSDKLAKPDTATAATETLGEFSSELTDEIPTGFLKPATRPDSLGRLGHYEILGAVGRGAFGTVVKAVDEKLGRVVAIKLLAPELAASSAARMRFLREARASASVRHDNVVSVYAVEEEPIPYLVMEYIPGQTLQERLDEHGPLGLVDALKIGKQIADGLAAAHAEQLIHRDVKPGNILLEAGDADRVTITDFGLARTADDASMTQSGVIAGTPLYMAPEQALGYKLDQRADLFSFGSVLYQMLTGEAPFRAHSTMAVLKRVTDDTPRPVTDLIPEIPDWMSRIVNRLLAKHPDDRFASAKKVSELLAKCLSDVQEGRTPEIPPSPEEIRQAAIANAEAKKKARRFSGPIAKAAALLVVLLMALGITEATGVTDLSMTVIRLVVGSGTLVIESIEPGVSITINGEEVTIKGGGVSEMTLRPGDYKVAALKGGKPLKQELVTITRNGRTTVRMSLEGRPRITDSHGASATGTGRTPSSEGTTATVPILKKTLAGHTTPIYRVVYSSDGKLLASGGDGDVRVWDVPSGKIRYVLPGTNQERYTAIAFSPDGKYLLTAPQTAPAPIRIWEADSGKPAGLLEGHYQKLYDISFSPNGQTLISGGFDPYVRLWDFAQRSKLKDIPSENPSARSAIISSRGQIVFGHKKIILADKDGKPFRTISKPAGPLCFSPDGRRVAGTTWTLGLVTVWDVDSGKELASWKAHDGYAEGLAFSKDGHVLATAGDRGVVRLWEPDSQALLAELPHAGRPAAVEFSPDGMTLATAGHDRLIQLWDVSEVLAQQQARIKMHDSQIAALPAAEQAQAVERELRRLNPDFGGEHSRITHEIEDGVVTDFSIVGMAVDRVSDISPVKALRGLKSFECRTGDQLSDLSPLKDMKLNHLSVGGWRLTDLSPLRDIELTSLNIEASSVKDLSPLKDMRTLRILNLFQTQVTDLSPLQGMQLTSLNLGRTGVTDLSPLEGMSLTSLSIGESTVSDLSLLEGMKLTSLNLYNTTVSDLSPLRGMPLEELNCQKTRVSDLSPLRELPLTSLECDFQAPRDTAILREIKSLKTINGKPAAEFWKDVSTQSEGFHWPQDAPPLAVAPFDAEHAKKHQAAWADYLGVPVESTNSLGMKLRLIPPGRFLMKPDYEVTITGPYWMGTFEVTVAEFRAFAEETGYKTTAERKGNGILRSENQQDQKDPRYTWRHQSVSRGDNYPIGQMSWEDATAFCKWLSQKEGKRYRLPTEAEWEWACRAGSMDVFHFGNDPKSLGDYAWFQDNANNETHSVGEKKPNAWELYDLYGNVSEYCQDWDGPLPTGKSIDPRGPRSGEHRVIRGNGYFGTGDVVKTRNRTKFVPGSSMNQFGFRVVCEDFT